MVEMLSSNNSEQLNVSEETCDKVAEIFDGKNTNEELKKTENSTEITENDRETSAWSGLKLGFQNLSKKIENGQDISYKKRNEKTAAENVMKQICGKENIDEIKMSDLKNLPDYKKNQLAWELAACYDGNGKSQSERLGFLGRNAQEIGKKLGLQTLSKWCGIATGDGAKDADGYILTSGIGGQRQIGVEYFDYGRQISETRSIRLGILNQSSILYISAMGKDIHKEGNGGGNCTITFGNEGKLSLIYGESGVVVDRDNTNLPGGVTYDEATGALVISQDFKEKNDGEIILTTNSNQYDNNSYDEVSFNFIYENAEIANTKRIKEPFKSGEYKLKEESKTELKENVTKIPNIYNPKVPLTCGVNIDNKGYYIPVEADAKAKLNQMMAGWNNLVAELKDKIGEEIINKLISQCNTKIAKFDKETRYNKDGNEEKMSSTNLNIQKQLAKNRMLESLNTILEDQKLVNALRRGKQINLNFRVTKDYRSIFIE